MNKTKIGIVAVSAMLAGCASIKECGHTSELDDYLAFCSELSLKPPVDTGDPDGYMSKPDWAVGSPMTTREFRKEYRIVYSDEKFLSFYAEEYSYEGGPHGFTRVTCGSFCRKTGKRLTLDDVFARDDRAALTDKLRAAVVKAIGDDEKLIDKVKPTENFYYGGDGWHFIYNPYEVASYSEGKIEVVLPK